MRAPRSCFPGQLDSRLRATFSKAIHGETFTRPEQLPDLGTHPSNQGDELQGTKKTGHDQRERRAPRVVVIER
jgi:hypothetical protein